MKKHGNIMTVLILLLIVILAVPSVADTLVTGGTEVTLTYEDACDMALKQTHSIAEIDQAIEQLSDQYNDAIALRMEMQELLRGMDEYRKLYDMQKNGTQLNALDRWQLGIYMGMFGPKPPEMSQTDIYKNYIVNRDITHDAVWTSLQNTKLNKETVKSSIKFGVRQIYDSILDLQDTISLQQQLYDNMLKQNKQMLRRFKLGQVSEIDKYLSEVSLNQQKLNIDKIKRNLDNLEMSLKQQLGISLKQHIILMPYKSNNLNKNMTYKEYLEKALVNRYETIAAKRDLEQKKREQDIMKQYILNDLLTERLEIQQAVDEKQMTYNEAVENVTKDIFKGYKDITELKANVDIAGQKQENAENQYKNSNLMYQNGLISLSNLWEADINRSLAKSGYMKTLRDYTRAIDKLEAACGCGPAYATSMGGLQ